MQLTKPFFINPKKNKTAIELCSKSTDKVVQDVHNPFQQIIAGELRNWFNTSRLVIFYHMNPMPEEEQFKARIQFKKANMHLKNYGKKTLEMAVKGTKYETVLDFYVSRNMTLFSPEPEIKKILKIGKKYPQLVLLGNDTDYFFAYRLRNVHVLP